MYPTACTYISFYLFQWNQIKCGVLTECKPAHVAPRALKRRRVIRMAAEEKGFRLDTLRRLSHFQRAHLLGRPPGSLILSSISPHYWQKPLSQHIVASHTVGSINLSAWQQQPIAHWDAPSPFWPGISCFSCSWLRSRGQDGGLLCCRQTVWEPDSAA